MSPELREGSRKAYKALRRKGIVVNHKKVERLWRVHVLTVPVKRRRRRRGKGLDRPLSPLYPNHVWTYDFMEDSCLNGLKLRILNVVDEFTREAFETYDASMEISTIKIGNPNLYNGPKKGVQSDRPDAYPAASDAVVPARPVATWITNNHSYYDYRT